MEDIITQISNVGFPIAITCYLLVRIENKLTDLTTSIHDLSKNIEKLNFKNPST